MKVTFIPIVIGALGTVTKGLVPGLEDLEITERVETVKATALLRSARILRRVQETCCHSNSSEKLSANADMKNSQGRRIMKKRTCKIVDFAVPADHGMKLKEREKRISTSTLLGN